MSRQTTLRWKGRTLEALFAQLPTEHRRRAERLYGQLIARAARGTMAVEDGVRRARRGSNGLERLSIRARMARPITQSPVPRGVVCCRISRSAAMNEVWQSRSSLRRSRGAAHACSTEPG